MSWVCVHEHQSIEWRINIERDLGRPAALLNLFRNRFFEEIAFAGFHANSSGSCSGESIDIPNILAPIVERGGVASEILLDDRELDIGVLTTEFVVGASHRLISPYHLDATLQATPSDIGDHPPYASDHVELAVVRGNRHVVEVR